MHRFVAFTAAATVAVASTASATDFQHRHHRPFLDFGQRVEALTRASSLELFGTFGDLPESSTKSLSAKAAEADPARLLSVAPGLRVRVVSAAANLAPNIDQMVLWPNAKHPTHIIGCNEQGSSQVGVQRIELKTGKAETIISAGLTSCDPARVTPWGTLVVGEENGTNGRIFEILDPIHTTNVTVPTSGFGPTSDPAHVVGRPALGQFSFEGIGILPNGVVYLTDENRPGGGGLGNPGGALVKFIPDQLWSTGAPPITSLDQSPWKSGSIFGFRVGRNGGNTDVGQGNEYGRGVWVAVTGTAPINLRAAASALKLTAYYRPEDMSVDQEALEDGDVRFCGTNTGQDVPDSEPDGDNHWGEVYCVTDGTVAQASAITLVNGINTASIPEYHPLVLGTSVFGMPDNIDIQPGRGNFLVDEDGEGAIYPTPHNNDIWDCLDDGDDADTLTDGCIRVMSLNDLTAEPTGGFFDATGTHYYVSIQHNITGHGVILDVTGWR
ncbi:MAG TPA: alkaline phosphatase PhoX [Steroidobacteraceae bacterium]|nr:alkaline phosphatase PhoX [Steroidobacteraceae bacterium]